MLFVTYSYVQNSTENHYTYEEIGKLTKIKEKKQLKKKKVTSQMTWMLQLAEKNFKTTNTKVFRDSEGSILIIN